MNSILLVDDDKDFRESLKDLLEIKGYLIYEAKNGAEGLRVFSRESIDLVISDLLMPEIDGLELLMGIRGTNSGTPIIVISGGNRSNFDKSFEIAQELGANIVLGKPVSADVLFDSIDQLLASSSKNKI